MPFHADDGPVWILLKMPTFTTLETSSHGNTRDATHLRPFIIAAAQTIARLVATPSKGILQEESHEGERSEAYVDADSEERVDEKRDPGDVQPVQQGSTGDRRERESLLVFQGQTVFPSPKASA